MKFREYILAKFSKEDEFDAEIGGVDMPCTFCGGEDFVITPYMEEKYGDLLNAEIGETSEDFCEVLYDNYKKGEEFSCSLAGYCSVEEYDKLTKN
jgi:hypothetical protein